jgi:hypothetical protein
MQFQVNANSRHLEKINGIELRVQTNKNNIDSMHTEQNSDHDLLVSINTKLDMMMSGKITGKLQ